MSDQRIEELRRLELFAGLGAAELRDIAAHSTLIEVPAGRVLCTQGSPGRECFVVFSGEARVTRNGAEVAQVRTGELFGEMALLDGHHLRTATVTTTTPMQVLVLDPREFSTLLQHAPLAQRVHDTVAVRLQER
jgi:CRP-like cAMP-binding protein